MKQHERINCTIITHTLTQSFTKWMTLELCCFFFLSTNKKNNQQKVAVETFSDSHVCNQYMKGEKLVQLE